jgi:hypothetical protein
MHLKHQIEVGHVHLGEALVAQDAGIVDQDMNAAPSFLCLGNHFDHLFKFGDAAAIGHGLAASSLDFFNNLRRRVGRAGAVTCTAQIVYDHLGTALGQFQSIGLTQSAACTGHNSDFVFKADGHFLSP